MQVNPDFLQYFGNPFYKHTQEKGWDKITSVSRWLQWPLEILIKNNETLPLAVNFTPNGNFGIYFKEGEKEKGILGKDSKPGTPAYNALFIDLDLSNTFCKDSTELMVKAFEVCIELGMMPSFVYDKPGGPHFYRIIDPEERENIDIKFSEEEFNNLHKYLCSLFVGSDISIAKFKHLMRLPLTNNWKFENVMRKIAPSKGTLYQWYDGELHTEFDAEKMQFIGIKELVKLSEGVHDMKNIDTAEKKITSNMAKSVDVAIRDISFESVFEKLKNYPRIFKTYGSIGKYKEYEGKKYVFELQDNNIYIRVLDDDILLKTSRYKLKKGNKPGIKTRGDFVNNFDDEGEYTIYERPRGPIFSFLYNYFYEDKTKVLRFFEDEFGITTLGLGKDTLTETERLYEGKDCTLLCADNGVKLTLFKTLPNGKTVLVNRELFDIPLFPLGYVETNITDDYLESLDINKLYVFEDPIHNRKVTLKRSNTKANFNKYVNRLGIYYYGDEDTLGMMFSTLDLQKHLPQLTPIMFNGVYDTFVLLGGKVIYNIEAFNSDEYYFNNHFTYGIASGLEQVSTQTFIDHMLECFDEKFVYLPILQYSAMLLMNVWQDKLSVPIYPAILFTGETGKGKSTIVDIFKSYGGYFGKSRELTVGGKSASKQPIKHDATDNSILFLEEVSGIIDPATEQTVRAIINRDRGAVGVAAGKNIYYNFKSPILALGQRMFIEDSINNRFAIFDMDHQNKKGTQEQLSDLKKFSCTNYVYEKYYENPHLIKSLYEKYVQKLVEHNLEYRVRDVIIYAFIMNELLNINIPFETLLEHITRHLKNVGLEKPKQQLSRESIFKSVLIEGFMRKTITGTYSDIENDTKTRYELFFRSDFLEQNRAKIHGSIVYFNDKAAEEGDGNIMYMIGNIMTITIRDVGPKKVDRVLNSIISWIVKIAKGALHYSPTM